MSLVATRLQNWRIENPELDRNMTRPCEYGALDFFIEQTNAPSSIINPNLRDRAFASIGNTVQVPVINYDGDVQVSNVRSCVIADDENTSALVTVVWATYAIGFTMVPAAYMNNEISYEHDFLRKMEKTCRALADKLDVGAVAALEANKTKVFKTLLNYTEAGNVVQVPTQMATEILGDINPIMRANCYPEYIHIIANAGVDSLIRKLAQHGVYNDVNKRMEYDNKVLHYTNNVTDEAGKMGTMFAVADGNVGILTRVDREALRRTRANFHEWDVVRLPYIDLPVGSHYYTAVGDQSAIMGAATADLTCAVKEYFGFSVDVAYMVAYNSNCGKPDYQSRDCRPQSERTVGYACICNQRSGISRRRCERITPEHNELLNRGDGVVIPAPLFISNADVQITRNTGCIIARRRVGTIIRPGKGDRRQFNADGKRFDVSRSAPPCYFG